MGSSSRAKDVRIEDAQVYRADVWHVQQKFSCRWRFSIVLRDFSLPYLSGFFIYVHGNPFQDLAPHCRFQPVSVISMIRVGRVEERERGVRTPALAQFYLEL
jgi:hypothetical protein